MLLKRFNVWREESDPAKIEELKRGGFVEVAPKSKPEKKAEEGDVLERLTKAELVKLAEEQGINTKNLKKDDLIQALNGR